MSPHTPCGCTSGAGDEWRVYHCSLHAAAPDLLKALEEIAKGEGAFSRDPLTHAENVIEHAKETARAAIRKATAP